MGWQLEGTISGGGGGGNSNFPLVTVAGVLSQPSVKALADYVCDGSNDKTQLNAALEQAASYGSAYDTGEVVFFNELTIPITSGWPYGVYVPWGAKLRGMYGISSQLTFTGSAASVDAIYVEDYGKLENIQIYRSGVSPPTTMDTISLNGRGAKVVDVRHDGDWSGVGLKVFGSACEVTRFDQYRAGLQKGIWVNGPGGLNILECVTRGTTVAGIHMETCDGIKVDHYNSQTANGVDVLVNDAADCSITDAVVEGNGGTFVSIDNSQRISVNGGILDFKANGIKVSNSVYIVLNGNNLNRTSGLVGTGVEIIGSSVIMNGNFLHRYVTGVSVAGTSDVTIGDTHWGTLTNRITVPSGSPTIRMRPRNGTGTIANAASTAVIAHGLPRTPQFVNVNGDGNETLWVTAIGATNFTVNRAGTTGARTVYWQAGLAP